MARDETTVKAPRKVVDHVVFFRMKDELTEEQEREMLEALFTLQYTSQGVIYLSVGPVLEKTVDGVTHALFARFMAKEHVELYMQSPERKRIAVDLVIPYYNGLVMLDIEDGVADDVEAIFGREFALCGGIDHFVLFKVKEGTSQESIDAMLQSFRDLAASMDPDSMFQLTAGTNFSPMGKGYTHGFIARLPSEEALEDFLKSDAYAQALSKEALPDGTEYISANLASAFRGSSVTLHGEPEDVEGTA
ncbi:stress-response A/B barrel domain-containing protein UP3 [Physcomitrium patens]|uniref:Stress-response A/B barrel domain-containing protein n=1 Tax=Physcomitrium patens TaxID=3218 RepID=A9SWV6_PHYPA|nr:stress-response A/B barrel domain-containing protein UP3-like [Physcomitrium patens]XP_024381550.1 stress-response A/B barrel domain-containing protein UP3-like [Physcomitrium patens]PNR50561.1 hypothetical protein PHYPA_009747 [Physcomitrium patens]|eukprot:XP_024381549.1 stress-response A/B barrel domain-containing protein UP3-like [Physcomitrella patens]